MWSLIRINLFSRNIYLSWKLYVILTELREIQLIYEDKLAEAGSFTKYRYRASTNEEMDDSIPLINNTAGSERKIAENVNIVLRLPSDLMGK